MAAPWILNCFHKRLESEGQYLLLYFGVLHFPLRAERAIDCGYSHATNACSLHSPSFPLAGARDAGLIRCEHLFRIHFALLTSWLYLQVCSALLVHKRRLYGHTTCDNSITFIKSSLSNILQNLTR